VAAAGAARVTGIFNVAKKTVGEKPARYAWTPVSDSAHPDQTGDPVGSPPTAGAGATAPATDTVRGTEVNAPPVPVPAPALRPGQRPVFESFFERDALRESRRRGRHRTLMISLAVHVVALLALVIVTFWQVDELWEPSVKVRVYTRTTLPPGTPVEMVAPPVAPAPPR
jgi:hypothetical protein